MSEIGDQPKQTCSEHTLLFIDKKGSGKCVEQMPMRQTNASKATRSYTKYIYPSTHITITQSDRTDRDEQHLIQLHQLSE